jgi:aromatic-L-amino-acid decarboxylase
VRSFLSLLLKHLHGAHLREAELTTLYFLLYIVSAAQHPALWLHVDGAWAGVALALPEFRQEAYLDAINARASPQAASNTGAGAITPGGEVQSLCTNLHKSGLVTFDASCLCASFLLSSSSDCKLTLSLPGVRDRALLTTALDVTPPFLRTAQADAGSVVDLRNMGLALGRRFRSLKLYFVLRSYGIDGFQKHLRKLDGLAQTLVKLAAGEIEGVAALDGVELFAPRRFSLVVFRIRSTNPTSSSLAYENALNASFFRIANADHSLLLTPTTVGGKNAIRVAVGSPFTEEKHIRELVEKLRAHTAKAREETVVV